MLYPSFLIYAPFYCFLDFYLVPMHLVRTIFFCIFHCHSLYTVHLVLLGRPEWKAKICLAINEFEYPYMKTCLKRTASVVSSSCRFIFSQIDFKIICNLKEPYQELEIQIETKHPHVKTTHS